MYFFFICLGLTNPPGCFSNFPTGAAATSLTSPSTSLSGSPLHKPQTVWSNTNTLTQQAGRSNPISNSSTSRNASMQKPVKTPGEAQPDYSRTNFDSVFGRSDYSKYYFLLLLKFILNRIIMQSYF